MVLFDDKFLSESEANYSVEGDKIIKVDNVKITTLEDFVLETKAKKAKKSRK